MTKTSLCLSFCLFLAGCGGTSSPPVSPDASTPDAVVAKCEDGMMRAATCGNCGMGQEVCQDGAWVAQGPCLNEGVCAEGSEEMRPAALCGEETRVCDNQCTWGDWILTTPGAGACEPGERRFSQEDCTAGLFRRQLCAPTCSWMNQSGPCVDECGEEPRVYANEDEEEVCVPAGPFRRGLLGEPDTEPVTTVMVSAFYIDKYVVTNRRYKECYDAGACGLTDHINANEDINNPSMGPHPTWRQTKETAETFCLWDGGKRLVTEAEWEKAARGPAPRENRYTWDDPTWRCDLLFGPGCPGWMPPPISPLFDAYDALPGTISYYGAYGMLGHGRQWTYDFYDPDYYSDPSSLIDPQGPPTGSMLTLRGVGRRFVSMAVDSVARRFADDQMGSSNDTVIRCGRTAVGL